MSEPIKVGDLVVVVKSNNCPCPHPSTAIGMIFKVQKITLTTNPHCGSCGRPVPKDYCAVEGDDHYALWRLKRIPDFPELADERHDEEITA